MSLRAKLLNWMDRAADWMAQRHILSANAAILMLCASMYLGTGGSLALFQFPSFGSITVDNYRLIINDPVHRATVFFTYMTNVMLLNCVVMFVGEFRTRMRWFPVAVLVELTSVTLLTVLGIFRYNDQLYAGITDPAKLKEVLDSWLALNWLRVSIWAVMWLTVMGYFSVKAASAIKARK